MHLALDPENHRQVACKSIRTKKESEVGQVLKEVRILMTLKHVGYSFYFVCRALTFYSNSQTSMKFTIQKKTKNSCSSHFFCNLRRNAETFEQVIFSFSSVLEETSLHTLQTIPQQETEYAKQKQNISCTNFLKA